MNVDDRNFSPPKIQLSVVEILAQAMVNCIKNLYLVTFYQNCDINVSVWKLKTNSRGTKLLHLASRYYLFNDFFESKSTKMYSRKASFRASRSVGVAQMY